MAVEEVLRAELKTLVQVGRADAESEHPIASRTHNDDPPGGSLSG